MGDNLGEALRVRRSPFFGEVSRFSIAVERFKNEHVGNKADSAPLPGRGLFVAQRGRAGGVTVHVVFIRIASVSIMRVIVVT